MDTPPPPPPQSPPPAQPTGGFPLPPPPPPRKGKSGCLKAFLITAAVLVVLGAGCVAAAVWWWNNNGQEFVAAGESATAEGAEAGAGTDEAGCVQLGRARTAQGEASVTGMVAHGAYVKGCLGAARETPGFCEGVPAETEFRATAEWRGRQCPGGDAGCVVVMQSVQQYCHRERPGRTFDPAPAATDAGAAAPDTGAASF